MDSEGEMIPKGGFGQEGGSSFGLFRKAAELLEKADRVRPRIAKHAEKREELYREQVAPGIYVKVNGLTRSGKLVEGDRRYEFDVFDVCEVGDDKLIFASDEQGAIQETTEGMGKRLASSFENELYPLIMDAMIYQGVDTLDRMSAIEHLRNIGESRWADYVMDEVDDGQWTDIVSDLINSSSDDFMNTAGYQGTGQWIAPGRPEGGEKSYPEEHGSDEGLGLEDEGEGGSEDGEKKKPEEKNATVQWEEQESYRKGYEYGSQPGAEKMNTQQISEYLSWDVLDAQPSAESMFNAVGNVSAFQHGMNDALSGQSKKIDEMTGQGDMFTGALRKHALDIWEGEPDEQPTGPTSEDIVMFPSGSLGSKTSVSEVEGKFLGEFETEDEAEAFIKQYMQQSGWYPDVWYQDDHGGMTLRTLASKRAGNEKDIWMAGRIQNLLASGEAQSRAHAEQLAAQQWDEQSEFAEAFERQQGGPMGYRDTGQGYNAPMQIDPSAESHIGKRANGRWEEIPLDEWKGMMPEMNISNEEIAQDFAEEMKAHPIEGDVGERLKGFIRQNYPQQLPEYNAILGIYNQLANQTVGFRQKADVDPSVPYDETKPWGGRPSTHVRYTEFGYTDEDDIPEAWLMGSASKGTTIQQETKYWFHQKWMEDGTAQRLIQEGKAQMAADGISLEPVTAKRASGGDKGQKQILRDAFQTGDRREFSATPGYDSSILKHTGCSPDEVGYVEWLMRGERSTLDSLSPEDFSKLANESYELYKYVMGKAAKLGGEDNPLKELEQRIKPVADQYAAAFGLTVSDLYVGSEGVNIELSGSIEDSDQAYTKAVEMFEGQFGVKVTNPVGPLYDTDTHDTVFLEERNASKKISGKKLIVREAMGETNEQVAADWHEFMISERGGSIGSPLAGLKLFVQYNYPDKLPEYEQIAEIYSNTQWPPSSVEPYPESIFPSD